MTKLRTIINVVSESVLGTGLSAVCNSKGVAYYYLAQLAARHGLPLATIEENKLYQIGGVNYYLDELQPLTIEDVGALRREHEG